MIDDLWYKNAVIYCLDVEYFMDGNGDGVGDFLGLRHKLDYLAGLGATCLWLLPFFPSPNRDNGYDVSDYYGVDRRLGDLGDFVAFSQQARLHGLRIIIDLVVNHTSNEHPWFQAARKEPKSRFRDFYVWSKRKPPDAREGVVFPGHQKSTWTYDSEARAYYFHRFFEFQPDLNVANPRVREELLKIMGFWLELGVSGFRVDAVPFLIERPRSSRGPRYDYGFLREMRDFLSFERGLRRRLAPMLGGDRRRLELAYSLMLTLPGTPVLWYGDELGMGEDLELPGRQSVRTPMQWSDERHAGFSTAEQVVREPVRQGPFSYKKVNVAAQRHAPGSMLNWMERMVRMRKECPELGWGQWRVLPLKERTVLGLRYEGRGNTLVVLHNLSSKPCELALSLEAASLVNVFSGEHLRPDSRRKFRVPLEAYGYQWLRREGDMEAGG